MATTAARLEEIETQLRLLAALVAALLSRPELEKEFEDQGFVIDQLIGIMHGTRLDIVQMRATLLRLAALLEQTLRARVEDEEREIAWRGEERRNIADRRAS